MKISDILVNFDAIRLKFGWWIAFKAVHKRNKFRSSQTRIERGICVLILCFEVARGQGP